MLHTVIIIQPQIICLRYNVSMKKKEKKGKQCTDLPPTELDLFLTCTHTRRCLIRAGVTTLAQLEPLSVDDLLQIRGIGQVIAEDVIREREQYLKTMQICRKGDS